MALIGLFGICNDSIQGSERKAEFNFSGRERGVQMQNANAKCKVKNYIELKDN